MPAGKIFLLLFVFTIAACHANNKWQNVEYDNNMICSEMKTDCVKEREIYRKAHVYLEHDTLYIHVFDPPPAGWEDIMIKVHDGKFCATAYGFPFEPIEISYTTLEQHLQLGKKEYMVGDTLCGECNFHFQFTVTSWTDDAKMEKNTVTFSFSGTIKEVVRTKDFDPFDKANFMTFDLPTALLELGEPLYQEKFNTLSLPEFRVELLNIFPAKEDIWIEEATWDASETRGVSDEGVDRLTIWYAQTDGVHWKPVHFLRWDKNTEF
jgi:hypothetical protein